MGKAEGRKPSFWGRLGWGLGKPVQWLIGLLYAGICRFLIPVFFRVEKVGEAPRRPCVLAVTHVGTFEPLFVAYASRFFRPRPCSPWTPATPFCGSSTRRSGDSR